MQKEHQIKHTGISKQLPKDKSIVIDSKNSNIANMMNSRVDKLYNLNYDNNSCINFDEANLSVISRKDSSLSEIRIDELNLTMEDNKRSNMYAMYKNQFNFDNTKPHDYYNNLMSKNHISNISAGELKKRNIETGRTEGKIIIETFISRRENDERPIKQRKKEGDKSYLDESGVTNDIKLFDEKEKKVLKMKKDESFMTSYLNDNTEERLKRLVNKSNNGVKNINNRKMSNGSISRSRLNKSQLSKNLENMFYGDLKDKIIEIKNHKNYTNFELSKVVYDVKYYINN